MQDIFRGMAGKPACVVDGESVRVGDAENSERFLVSMG
jgi:hypothetical protein